MESRETLANFTAIRVATDAILVRLTELTGLLAIYHGAIVVQADGGASVITTGRKGGYIQMPYSGIITGWSILGNEAGSVVIDVWRSTLAGFPPTVANTITGGNKPTIAGQQSAQGGVAGWATGFGKDDVFAFNVDSVSAIKQLTLTIAVQRD